MCNTSTLVSALRRKKHQRHDLDAEICKAINRQGSEKSLRLQNFVKH